MQSVEASPGCRQAARRGSSIKRSPVDAEGWGRGPSNGKSQERKPTDAICATGRGQPAHTPTQRPPGAERKGRHKGRKTFSKPDCTDSLVGAPRYEKATPLLAPWIIQALPPLALLCPPCRCSPVAFGQCCAFMCVCYAHGACRALAVGRWVGFLESWACARGGFLDGWVSARGGWGMLQQLLAADVVRLLMGREYACTESLMNRPWLL
eukprot:366291-Chlamydomonas_euryale.AAC.7